MNMNSDYRMNPISSKPVIPMPNLREGEPAYPRNESGRGIPVIPLPNPGEGGPAAPGGGSGSQIPVIPLPNPGEGGPAAPGGGSGSQIPVIPLPNPGEGGPAYPGNRPNNGILPGIISTIISMHPKPNAPCEFCPSPSTPSGNVRFLNTANNYNPFMIYVNQDQFTNALGFSEITEYERVPSGSQIVTVLSETGYIYIQKPVMVPRNGFITVAIINTESGMDLTVISDASCSTPYYLSCMRTCNLSYNSGPLNVIIGDQYITFKNVQFKEVTEYKGIWAGKYGYYISRNNRKTPRDKKQEILLESGINIQTNASYTMYIFNWDKASPDAIKVLIVEEQR